MKKILSILCKENYRSYQVWSYLWFCANSSNEVKFTLIDVGCRLGLSKSTTHRIINDLEFINDEKIHIVMTKRGASHHVKFYDKGKPVTKIKDPFIEELFLGLKKYYESKDFQYSKLRSHKPYLLGLLNQIKETIKKEGKEPTEQAQKDQLNYLFKNLPSWYVENGHIKLTTLNKSYPTLLTKIKNKKTDDYASEIQSTESIDYSDLAEK